MELHKQSLAGDLSQNVDCATKQKTRRIYACEHCPAMGRHVHYDGKTECIENEYIDVTENYILSSYEKEV